jgi:hypothetical protein
VQVLELFEVHAEPGDDGRGDLLRFGPELPAGGGEGHGQGAFVLAVALAA